MKKLSTLLAFVSVMGIGTMAEGQSCSPVTNLPDSVVVYPLPYSDTNPQGGITDTACVGSYYEFVFTLKTPATFQTPFGPIPINSIDMATEGAITNLPPSFDYVCNPPNCSFKKDSIGCLVIFGTAASDTGVGVYDLGLSATIRSVIDVPFTFPDPNLYPGNYYLHVKPAGSANCFTVDTKNPVADAMKMSISPNPMWDQAVLQIQSALDGAFEFAVYDMLGKRVMHNQLNLTVGENHLPFDGSRLSDGIYIYTVGNNSGVISDKLVISRR